MKTRECYERHTACLGNTCEREFTLDRLKTMPLSRVSDLYSDGQISRELAQEYADLWNAGPHFTKAVVCISRIINTHSDYGQRQTWFPNRGVTK